MTSTITRMSRWTDKHDVIAATLIVAPLVLILVLGAIAIGRLTALSDEYYECKEGAIVRQLNEGRTFQDASDTARFYCKDLR